MLSLFTEKKVFLTALSWKILMGLALAAIYTFHYKNGDTLFYYEDAVRIQTFLINNPIHFFLGDTREYLDNSVFVHTPRAFFFVKIVALVSLFSFNNYWITTILFSTLSFIGTWFLYTTIIFYFPGLKKQAAAAFLFIPTYVFWTSGVLKESIANLCICFIVGSMLKLTHQKKIKWNLVLAVEIFAYILYGLKYYFFAVLFPPLISYLLYYKLELSDRIPLKSVRIFITCLLLMFFSLAMMVFHPYLNPLIWKEVITESSQNIFRESHAGITMIGVIKVLPQAITSTWFFPLWHGKNLLYIPVIAENFLLGVMLAFSFFKVSNFLKWKLEVWMILFVIILTGCFMGLTISNAGSLVRYKSVFYPFLFLLCTPAFETIFSFIKGIFAGKKENHGEAGHNFWSKRNWQNSSADFHK